MDNDIIKFKDNSIRIVNLSKFTKQLRIIGEEVDTLFEFSKQFPGFEFLGVNIPESRKGKKIRLKTFLALFLEEKGYGSIHPTYSIDLNSLRNFLESEKSRTALIKLPPFFIERCLILLSNPNTKHREKMLTDFKQLIEKREKKLLRKIGPLSETEIKRNLSEPEQVLFKHINLLLKNWTDIFTLT